MHSSSTGEERLLKPSLLYDFHDQNCHQMCTVHPMGKITDILTKLISDFSRVLKNWCSVAVCMISIIMAFLLHFFFKKIILFKIDTNMLSDLSNLYSI